jgi:hypothetical protein
MFRSVGALNFPTSSARWVISYTPVLGGGYDSAPGKIVQPGVVELERRPMNYRFANVTSAVSVPVTLGAGTQQLTLLFDTGGINVRTIVLN